MSEELPVLHRGVGAHTKCRSCKADIVFALVYSSGKNTPFQKDDQGEWILENGIAKHAGPLAVQADLFAASADSVQRWTSHFSVCPQGDQWRKR